MPLRHKLLNALPKAALLSLAICAVAPSAQAQRQGPFAGLSGSWSGTGTISLSSGAKERISCRANYEVEAGGDALRQNLRCAGDSYSFDLRSRVEHSGGKIQGIWSEATRNASGSVSGSVSGGTVQARVEGGSFNADLSMTTRGDRQTVTIRSEGTELTGVSVSLARGGR